MRSLGVLLLALALAGCGSTKATPPARGGAKTLVVRPGGRNGFWRKLLLSPDGKTYLGQWSGECEVQETFFVPAAGGEPRPVTGRGEESVALGWAPRNRARILVPRAACGSQFRRPGVYLVDRSGHSVLVTASRPKPGGA